MLLLMVAAVFGQTVDFDFVNFDDRAYVLDNDSVTGGLTAQGLYSAFTQFRCSNWHPLTWISHMSDCQLYGLWPGGHHLTNVVLHGATAVLLFLLLLQMTGALQPSAFATALFAIHPLRAESVAWVSERKDVLSGFFFVLTLVAYVRYVRLPFSRVRYLTVLCLFACGLMAKQMLVTLPCVLLLLDWWPLGRFASFGRAAGDKQSDRSEIDSVQRSHSFFVLAEKIPLFALALSACAVTIFAQRQQISSHESLSFSTRVANALASYLSYSTQLVIPVNLAAFYPYSAEIFPAWKAIGSLTTLAIVSLLAVMARGKHPYLLVGWLWFLGMFVPVIGIVQIGAQATADRYTYLPHIGLCIMVAWGAAEFAKQCSIPAPRQAIGAGLLVTTLMAYAWCQTSYWQNSETLWRRALACTTGNWLAHNNLGSALLQQNRVDEAIEQFQSALIIFPSFSEPHINLANALARQGHISQAVAHYKTAIEIRPGYPSAHFNLACLLAAQGDIDAAIAEYEKALGLLPNYAEAHNNLGNALIKQGRTTEAINHLRRFVEIRPNDAAGHRNLGLALEMQGKTTAAIDQYENALKILPTFTEAHYNLGHALATEHRLDEAIEHYRQAVQIEPGFFAAQINLCEALVAQGKREVAITECQRALALAETRHHDELADTLRDRLRRYQMDLDSGSQEVR